MDFELLLCSRAPLHCPHVAQYRTSTESRRFRAFFDPEPRQLGKKLTTQTMSAGTVLEPPPMYRIRPYFEIKKVRLPNCMYQVKPLHKLLQMKTGSDEVWKL